MARTMFSSRSLGIALVLGCGGGKGDEAGVTVGGTPGGADETGAVATGGGSETGSPTTGGAAAACRCVTSATPMLCVPESGSSASPCTSCVVPG